MAKNLFFIYISLWNECCCASSSIVTAPSGSECCEFDGSPKFRRHGLWYGPNFNHDQKQADAAKVCKDQFNNASLFTPTDVKHLEVARMILRKESVFTPQMFVVSSLSFPCQQ